MQRWNPYETVLGVSNAGSLQVKWKNPMGIYDETRASSPAVVNGVVYFGSDDKNMYALNADVRATRTLSDQGRIADHPSTTRNKRLARTVVYSTWGQSLGQLAAVDEAQTNVLLKRNIIPNHYSTDRSSEGLLWPVD